MTGLELGRVTDRKLPHKYSALARVGFSDTDAQGIVYYGRYMPFFDLARFEYLRHLDLLERTLAQLQFVMRASTVEYHAPARFDDLLEVFVRTKRLGRSSATTGFAAYRAADDVLMCVAEQTLVLVDAVERRAVPIPESFRAPVRAFEGADLEEVLP
jgi:acyl-CoA thioester hydrolase